MRIVLNRFCKFTHVHFRLLPVLCKLRFQADSERSPLFAQNWTEGEELLLIIQAKFACEFTTAKNANVLVNSANVRRNEPQSSTFLGEGSTKLKPSVARATPEAEDTRE